VAPERHVAKERAMTVVCAWCQRQGRTTVLREKEPLDWAVVSHGICEEHAKTFLAEVRETKAAAISLDRRGS
jgi:wyosine [tRNA(Phe)-imidazoG37] synthetase (radical SAM superfamily)